MKNMTRRDQSQPGKDQFAETVEIAEHVVTDPDDPAFLNLFSHLGRINAPVPPELLQWLRDEHNDID